MRLQRLVLERYGSFEHADLALAPEPGRISLIVAPNGAGKSVLRQAFHDLLFDIPVQSPMQFRFGYRGMRLHAEAIAADGVAFSFGWTRGAKPQQRVTSDPARFAALRAETTPKQLEQLFALDTRLLRQGGSDLKGGTTLASALLSGTGELAPARKVQAEIEIRRAANLGQGRSSKPLNTAIAQLALTRKAARAAVQRPQYREQQEQALAAQRATLATAHHDQQQAQAATRRLNRIALTRPHLEALAVARTWFAGNPAAPALPAALEQNLADAQADLARTAATLAAAAAALQQAEAQLEKFPPDVAVEAHRSALSHLPGQLGTIEKAATDRVELGGKRAAALAAITAALRGIGAAVPAEQVCTLIPTVGAMAAARAAITEQAGLLTAGTLGTRRVKQARQRLDAAGLATPAAEPVPTALAILLQDIRADRNPVQHAGALAKTEREAAAALAKALAEVPGWAHDAAALLTLAPPSEPLFERLDADRQAAAADARAHALKRDEVAKTLATTTSDLAALQEAALPSPAAVAAARAERDRGWRLISRRAFAADPDPAGERAYAGGTPMPLAFERHMRNADDLADRHVRELTRVETAERLARELQTLRTEHAEAAGTADSAEAASTRAAAAWAGAAAPLGLQAGATMTEARLFLNARLRVIDAVQAHELAAGQAAAAAAQHRDWAARLAGLLRADIQPLAVLLPLADARLSAAQAAQQALAVQSAALVSAQTELAAAEQARQEASDALDGWQRQWNAILAGLGRPADEAPTATTAVLDRLTELDRHHQEVIGFDQRIGAMGQDAAAFAAEVAALAHALGEPEAKDAAETARTLIARRDRAASQDSARAQAATSFEDSRTTHKAALEKARTARQELDAVIAATGAADLDAAAGRIAAARDYARHAAMRDQAEAKLAEHGDGLPLDALHSDAASVPPDAIAAARTEADARAAAANARAEAAAVAADQLQRAFDADAETTAAVVAASDHAAAAAQYGRLLDEQIVLQLAASMLRDAMAAVEQDAGDQSLAHISAAFAAVTGGAYGVALDALDGTTLHAVERRFPGELKSLEQLSEGTQDQLYLALRLVALRAHAAAATPLPFIADDILQTFDDGRATAALRALVDLSTAVQVIVLTHHEHLARLAETLPPSSVCITRL